MLRNVRAIIGVVGDPEGSVEAAYLDAVVRGGGEPKLLLSVEEARTVRHAALLLCGGPFDIPPQWYGQAPRARIDPPRLARNRLERALLEEAEQAGLPVLGICNGCQLMAVHRGGSLVQDLRTSWPDALEHERSDLRGDPVHQVELQAGSRLANVLEETLLGVNSTHHQGIAVPGRSVCVVGRAPDGVVEAIEDPGRPFWFGVQWHPERLHASHAQMLFEVLTEAARRHAASR